VCGLFAWSGSGVAREEDRSGGVGSDELVGGGVEFVCGRGVQSGQSLDFLQQPQHRGQGDRGQDSESTPSQATIITKIKIRGGEIGGHLATWEIDGMCRDGRSVASDGSAGAIGFVFLCGGSSTSGATSVPSSGHFFITIITTIIFIIIVIVIIIIVIVIMMMITMTVAL
jgi:hypothetical protein